MPTIIGYEAEWTEQVEETELEEETAEEEEEE